MHFNLFNEPEKRDNRAAKDAYGLKYQNYEVDNVGYRESTLELIHVPRVKCREFGNADTSSNENWITDTLIVRRENWEIVAG